MIRIGLPLLLVSTALAQQLSPPEARGKKIFLTGSGSIPITAQIAVGSADVPATQVPCASCHGPDGRGRPEGGVEPSNIQWNALAGSAEVVHSGGRRHPAYTERAFNRAISLGIDPAGNALAPSMPRYRMSREDLTDLIAYVKKLDSLQDPGVTVESVRVGIILPPESTMRETRTAVKAVLGAYFDQVNRDGGVFNRKIVPQFLELPVSGENPAQFSNMFSGMFNGIEPFVLTASFLAGMEGPMSVFLENNQIPLVGALSLFPARSSPLNPYVFYLDAGLPGEVAALVDYLEKRFTDGPRRSAIVCSDDPISAALRVQVRERLWKLGWPQPMDLGPADPNLTKKLGDSNAAVVFYLTSAGSTSGFLKTIHESGSTAELLLPGSFADPGLPETNPEGRVVLAFASLPTDRSPDGIDRYRRLAQEHSLPADHLLTQWKAIASAELLVKGLSLAGRDLTRQKLLDALETIYKFPTGFTAPVSYGPNQRIGILEDRVVVLDKHSP
jgi:ABC-type branched-subunit amino acid transport system substrate-binding protein/mono/diheme cytochrome c family protein